MEKMRGKTGPLGPNFLKNYSLTINREKPPFY
jgi:hypothetical protein